MLTEATAANMLRKSAYVDRVQMRDGAPVFSSVDLSVTELCNRSAGSPKACQFCPRADASVYPNQKLHMPVSLAAKIAAELRGIQYQGIVLLCGFGEPLLHPQILDVVRCFTGIRLEIVTNGDRLTPRMARDLFSAGADHIAVSCYDGPHQIEHFTDLFRGENIGTDQYALRDRWHGAGDDFGLKLTNRGGTIEAGHQEPVDQSAACHYPAYQMAVDWNGDCLLCVQDWTKKLRFGNLHTESLWDIWRSPALHKRRMQLLGGRRCGAPCGSCNATGTLHGAQHAAAWA